MNDNLGAAATTISEVEHERLLKLPEKFCKYTYYHMRQGRSDKEYVFREAELDSLRR